MKTEKVYRQKNMLLDNPNSKMDQWGRFDPDKVCFSGQSFPCFESNCVYCVQKIFSTYRRKLFTATIRGKPKSVPELANTMLNLPSANSELFGFRTTAFPSFSRTFHIWSFINKMNRKIREQTGSTVSASPRL